MFDYIAPCNGECTTVDKSTLQFTKFAQGAWISGNDPGVWVTDDLVKTNNSWTTTIPANLAPGNYVVRHEIIALQNGQSVGGAELYPSCLQVTVSGGGQSGSPSPTVKFPGEYTPQDAGLLGNVSILRLSKQIHSKSIV